MEGRVYDICCMADGKQFEELTGIVDEWKMRIR